MERLSEKCFAVIAVFMLMTTFCLAVHDKAYIAMFGNASYMLTHIYKKEDENSRRGRVQKKLNQKDKNK
ncbi:MAG: hypothetical protein MET45_07015 [Nostoc sp. LLA-1]|nr:hypothetical protein [Cyanocohniella sp. LLY]